MTHKGPQFILSPCGTSLLTNSLTQADRSLVFTHANCKSEADIPEPDRSRLKMVIGDVRRRLASASLQDAQRLSAELNCLIRHQGPEICRRHDFYFLLATDTWLGEQTALLVESWIRQHCVNASTQVWRVPDLQTRELEPFQLALSEIVRFLEGDMAGYRSSGYRIIFNLTGGFKSVQGFLQSVAHFYADETIYIFESSDALMRIPRLPISIDARPIIETHLKFFRRLTSDLPVKRPDDSALDIFLLEIDGSIALSPWGEVIWNRHKKEIYRDFLPSPYPERIRYEKQFETTVRDLSPERRRLVNERLDDLARFLCQPDKNIRRLDFKPLQGRPLDKSTHELDAWSDQNAWRIFGHYEGDCFVLDSLGEGLH